MPVIFPFFFHGAHLPAHLPSPTRQWLKILATYFQSSITRFLPKGEGTSKTSRLEPLLIVGTRLPTSFWFQSSKTHVAQQTPKRGVGHAPAWAAPRAEVDAEIRVMYVWNLLRVVPSKHVMTKCHKASSEMHCGPNSYTHNLTFLWHLLGSQRLTVYGRQATWMLNSILPTWLALLFKAVWPRHPHSDISYIKEMGIEGLWPWILAAAWW